LDIKGNIFSQGTPPLTNIGGMFDGRKITNIDSARFVDGVAHYCNVASTANDTVQSFIGELYVEDISHLDWFDYWGAWNRSGIQITPDSEEYQYQDLTKVCRGGGTIRMRVYFPTPD
jgi:hypothetical protein